MALWLLMVELTEVSKLAKLNKTNLKALFASGNFPTQSNFEDLIDSSFEDIEISSVLPNNSNFPDSEAQWVVIKADLSTNHSEVYRRIQFTNTDAGSMSDWELMGELSGGVGPQGIPGVQGAPGADGADGVDGTDGADGADGVDGVSGNLQDAYDNGELITTDATNGAVTIKQGSGSDTDIVLSFQNGAGTEVLSVTGDGAVTINNFLTTNAPIIANAPIQHKAIDSYYDSTGALQGYIYAHPTQGMVIQANVNEIDEIHLIDDTFVSQKLTTTSLEVSGISDLQGPATLGASVTLSGITSATPTKTLGRNASNQIVEFDNVVAGGQVDSVVAGIEITIAGTATDPIVNAPGIATNASNIATNTINIATNTTDIAGKLDSVFGGTNVTIDNTDPINPIINVTNTVPRVTSVTSTTTLTVDSSTTDQAAITAQSGALTIASPTGSPANGQKLIIRIKAVGISVITWNAIFRIIGTTLPISTTANKTIYVGLIYNSLDTKWDVVAVAEEA